jgi:uncharacterized protein YutE (UPF0331/DUF86 family)
MVHTAILYKRIAGIRDHLDRVRSREGLPLQRFLEDRDSQDVVLHNLQLAIQGCIDLATHIVVDEGWGLPGTYGEVFTTLCQRGLLDADLARRLALASGLRNILVHDYLAIDLEVIHKVC